MYLCGRIRMENEKPFAGQKFRRIIDVFIIIGKEVWNKIIKIIFQVRNILRQVLLLQLRYGSGPEGFIVMQNPFA